MKKTGFMLNSIVLALYFLICFSVQNSSAQPLVGLDNWFNRETDVKTGLPYHYLWSDTAWSGYSKFGEIFESGGARIMTVDKPTATLIDDLDIYIIVDPDTTTESKNPNYILPGDIKSIKKWVRGGGVLVVLANDGPNCEFTHLNELMKNFGMKFNPVTLHPVTGTEFEMGACTNLPPHPLFRDVSKIYIKEVSDIILSRRAKPVLKENSKVLMAETQYGKGYVFAVGDPWIYNEYIDHDLLPDSFMNRKAAENLVEMLLNLVGP